MSSDFFTGRRIRITNHNFIFIPNGLIESVKILNHRELNTNELYVILKFYRYNFLESFGGVDFKILRKEAGKLYINKRLYKAIYLSKMEFIKILQDLERRRLVTWVDIIVKYETIDFEQIPRYLGEKGNSISTKTSDYKIISVLRPIHQIKI